jgi:hypothetical protein
MAQSKTRKAGSRSPNGSSPARSTPKGSSSQRTKGSTSARSRNARPAGARSASQGKRSAARNRSQTAERRRDAIANATDKAKVPAIAVGAALAGVAGGVALGRNGKPRVSLPSLGSRKSMVKLLGGSAKEIGKAGYRIGQLTSEVRKVREAVSASTKD